METEQSAIGGKRPNVIHWYYNEAVHGTLEIWKNFLFFVWQHFSISQLLRTLFSPWRRDVSSKNWRGLHPLMSLQLFFANIISRILGAIVRVGVVAVGFVCLLFVLLAGMAVNVFWIAFPLAAAAAFFFLPQFGIDALHIMAFVAAWILMASFFYFQDTKNPMLLFEFSELLKHPVFERICARIGIVRKRFPKEIFESLELFDEFLKSHNLTQKDYLRLTSWELQRWQKKNDQTKFWRWEYLKKIPAIGAQWHFGYTVNLDRYCQDLSRFDPTEYSKTELVGREDEYEVLKLVLERPDQNCVLIVGNAGIGKKTILHTLARNVRLRQELGALQDTRLLVLDLGRAISDAINKGEDVENFLRLLFYEAAGAGNVILVIEHFEYFLGKDSSTYHPDISAVLSEFLHIPTFQIVASSTPHEYHQLIEKQEHVAKYFEVIEVREPSEEEAEM
ncbi:MAG: hypothetical protein PHW24_00005, partial [Candidatus Moranbacteria bacterium]|nr:hypothetical protein [Candidatus Moranbacteria bacterium]